MERRKPETLPKKYETNLALHRGKYDPVLLFTSYNLQHELLQQELKKHQFPNHTLNERPVFLKESIPRQSLGFKVNSVYTCRFMGQFPFS